MSGIRFSNYAQLNTYEILATTLSTVGTTTVVNNTTSTIGNWGATTITGTFASGGSNPGSLDNSATLGTAQGQRTTLIADIDTYRSTLPQVLVSTTGTIPGGGSYQPNTDYFSQASSITYSGGTITFDAGVLGSSAQFFITADASITFANVTAINLLNGANAANIFITTRTATLSFTGTSPSAINGNLISGAAISFANSSTINGKIIGTTVSLSGTPNTANALDQPAVICFNKGTKILCVEDGVEVYRLIEDIKLGDLVKTHGHGDLPVEYIEHGAMINNPNVFHECMYRLPSKNPEFEDLVVTGGHGILKETLSEEEILADHDWFTRLAADSHIDGLFLQRAGFCKEFVQLTDNDQYIFYHLSLKGEEGRRYGIWANGVLSESTYKRDMIRAFGCQ